MHIDIDIDDETRDKVREYAKTFKVNLSRAYAEILRLGLELVEAGEFKNTSKVTKK